MAPAAQNTLINQHPPKADTPAPNRHEEVPQCNVCVSSMSIPTAPRVLQDRKSLPVVLPKATSCAALSITILDCLLKRATTNRQTIASVLSDLHNWSNMCSSDLKFNPLVEDPPQLLTKDHHTLLHICT